MNYQHNDNHETLTQCVKRPFSGRGYSPGVKKARLSPTTLEEFTLAGKTIIASPFVFPEGYALNWGSTSVVSSQHRDAATTSNHKNQAMDPIVVDSDDKVQDESVSLPLVQDAESSSKASVKASILGTTVAGSSEADPICIFSSDEEDESNPICFLKETFPDNLDPLLGKNTIVFRGLSSDISFKDIFELLDKNRFTSSVVRKIVIFRSNVASIQFTHSHIADAAFTVFFGKASPFPKKGQLKPLIVERWPCERTSYQTRSTTQETKGPVVEDSSTEDTADVLYGAIRTDIYEDSDKDRSSDEEQESSSDEHSALRISYAMSAPTSAGLEYLSHEEMVKAYGDTHTTVNCLGINHALTSSSIYEQTFRSTRRPQPSETRGKNITHANLVQKKTARLTGPVPTRTTSLSKAPDAPYNRARRVLVPTSASLPIVTVSMRSDVQFYDRRNRYRVSSYSLPGQADYCHVEDACSIGDAIIVAYSNGPCQISLVNLIEDERPSRVMLKHQPHLKLRNRDHDKKYKTVCCIAAPRMSTSEFITGGYDKSIRLWTKSDDIDFSSEKITQVATRPNAIAWRGRTILVGTSNAMLTVDMEHLTAKPQKLLLSNKLNQIHVHSETPSLLSLEVDHLDTQMQMYDNRSGKIPVCQFGYRHEGRAATKYARGSADRSYFVRGYPDGCVCLWDCRNTKRPVTKAKQRRVEQVVHTLFTGTEIICFGEDTLTYLDYQGNVI